MTLANLLRRKMTLAVMGATFGLAACGNDDQQFQLDELRSIASEVIEGREDVPDGAQAAAVIRTDSRKALATTPAGEPLASVRMDSVGIAAVLRRVATNGRHITWAAWGTSDRKSLTTKDGMIVATRSLHKDLMSAESDAVNALVRGRKEGNVPYILRYTDGNYDTIEERYTCTVTRGYNKVSTLANGRTVPVLQMFSTCNAADQQFVDLFLVDHGGRIVEMRQWVGPVLGFAYMAQLR
ncbi:MAG: YjbF family lipoprotein [Pseudomonadota bacterium]